MGRRRRHARLPLGNGELKRTASPALITGFLSLSFFYCGSAICDTLCDTLGVHGAVTARANRAFRRQLARINPVPRLPHQAEAVPSPPSPPSLSLPARGAPLACGGGGGSISVAGGEGKWMLLTGGSLDGELSGARGEACEEGRVLCRRGARDCPRPGLSSVASV